jgi:protease IV
VAQPGTIAASIGVLGDKILSSGLWDKIGISWDEVHNGANATMFTGVQDYSPAEWQRFQDWLNRVYADFTSKVADGRKLPKDKVLEIAKGRIWTGEDAKGLGLVDELGGFDTALNLAKKSANIAEREEVKVVVFPHKKTLLESLLQREGPDNSEKEATGAAAVMNQMLQVVQPIAREMHALGVDAKLPGDDVLLMPALDPGK